MKGLAITSRGIEDISALEIKELINCPCEIKDSCIIFQAKSFDNLALLCYKAQSVDKILLLLSSFECKKLNEIEKISLSKWKNKSFRVSCSRLDCDLDSQEICSKVGELIKIKKVDLNNPDTIFHIHIVNNTCYLGIDFSGAELHKREYRIFTHSKALRATIAYSLLRIADIRKKDTILDPFTGSGTIPIEAALYLTEFPVNYYNKDKFAFLKFHDFDFEKIKCNNVKPTIYGYDSFLGHIMNAKKNAKIAGVHKLINFSRVEVGWLDTKFEKESIDKIITQPPTSRKDMEKIYNELFYQAEFILKKDGKIILISKELDKLTKSAAKYKFKLADEISVYSGKAKLKIGVFQRYPLSL
jgi:putative N6-adenine-specific DNA methylase